MRLLLSLVTLLLSVSVFAAERNIIFIITDDQSPTLGCYGDPVAYSPAVDRLAEDGTLFIRAYATTASCSASRSVVMSGLHNHHNGQYGHTHAYHKFESYRNVVSLALPRVLANEGYRTAQIGKYHVAPEEVFHYETYLRANGRNAVQMANVSESFITADDPRPFFLYFATNDPHRGGGKDEYFAGKLKPDLFGNLPNDAAHEGVNEVIYDPDDVVIPPFLPDTAESRSELAQYYQSTARVDQGVERLIEILKENDLFDKTLIVFTADHGMAFAGAKTTIFEGGLRVPFIVRNPYEKNRGVQSDAMISHIDITPSLLDFAGGLDKTKNAPKKLIPASKYWKKKDYVFMENMGKDEYNKYHGKSWIGILGNSRANHWEVVFGSHTFHEIQMYYPMRSVNNGRYKLIWNIAAGLPYPFASDLWASSTWQASLAKGPDTEYGMMTVDEYVNRPTWQLYELGEVGYEDKNLAEDPHYAKVLNKMKAKLKEYQKTMNDPWIMKWEYE
ncbi:MAG: sulfatase [Verrucomicrobia bacterium]|nr:sulfatase [Verrucomicrobiota bacterium]